MKLIFFTLVCFCLNLNSFSQVSLEVKIKNLNAGIAYLWNTNSNRVDTVKIQNGYFKVNPDLDEPTLFYLKIEEFNEFDLPIRLLLSSDKTALIFNSLTAAVRNAKWKDLYPNQPEYAIDPNQNYLLRQFERSWIDFSDSIMSLTGSDAEETALFGKRKQLYNSYLQSTEKLLVDNSDKIASAVALYEFLIRNNLVDIEKTKQLYDKLDEPVKYSVMGMKIGYHINKLTSLATGSEVPYFEFSDINGKTFTSKDFKGRKTLLHFWSSICGPCRVENREVLQLGKLNEELAIVNISLDVNKEKWIKALQKDRLESMLNACDLKGNDGTMAQAFYVHGIPAYYLINEYGIIVGKGTLSEIENQLKQ